MPIEVNQVVFVKISGEPVFVLREDENVYIPLYGTPGSTPTRKGKGYEVRRFVKAQSGAHYSNFTFFAEELETEEDARKRFEKEEQRVMEEFAKAGGQLVVDGTSGPVGGTGNVA